MKKISILVISVLLIILSSCAAFFQPKVPMDFDSSGAYLEDLLVEKTKGGKLGTPSQVVASKNLNPSSINITWTSVPNAVSYRIEYAVIEPDGNGEFPKEVSEELFNVLEQNCYGTSLVHKIKDPNMQVGRDEYKYRYYYRVIATNEREGYDEGEPSKSDVYGTLFAPPLNARATAGESEDYINVSWDPVPGASRYEVMRSEASSGAGAGYIETVLGNKNTFQDVIANADKGKEFYYIIYAINKYGVTSDASSVAMGYSLVPGAPPQPKGLKITEGRGNHPDKIMMEWSPIQGENIKYNVYRYSSEDTALTIAGRDLTENKFTDKKNLKPGVYYYYLIQATKVDDLGETLKSPFSKAEEGFILSPPENLKAKKVEGGVDLTWDKAIGTPEEQAKYSYKIYTSNELDGVYEEKFTTQNTKANIGPYSFFKIKTVANNIESVESEVVAPAPYAVNVVNVSRADYSFLGDNPTANDAGVYPVKITWEKTNNENPYGYHVYRSLKEDVGYRKITENVILAPNTTFIDADSTLKPGRVYYYKVLTVNVLEKGENFSNSQYGWGALTHERYLKEFNETIVSSQKKLTLMHKPGSTDKLGTETKDGTISGTVYYNAAVAGLGAYITMKYTNYADFYINDNPAMGIKFKLSGNSDTSANMSSNGTMNGTITCTGMYPGKVNYNKIEIKAGAAGGGFYGVTPDGFTSVDVEYDVLEK